MFRGKSVYGSVTDSGLRAVVSSHDYMISSNKTMKFQLCECRVEGVEITLTLTEFSHVSGNSDSFTVAACFCLCVCVCVSDVAVYNLNPISVSMQLNIFCNNFRKK